MEKFKWLVVALMFVMVSSVVIAEEDAVEEDADNNIEWIDGKVKVTKDKEGKITAAVLESMTWDENDNEVKVIYKVVMDEKGMKLAKECDGKNVEVSAIVEKKDKVIWIKVKSYEAMEAEEAAE